MLLMLLSHASGMPLDRTASIISRSTGGDQAQVLPVLIAGQERGLSNSQNEVIRASPAETWSMINAGGDVVQRPKARFFACADRPIEAPILTQQWVFNASSQFARLHECLLRIEAAFPSQHHAFLRIRPDFLVLAPLRQTIEVNAFLGKYYYYPGYLGAATSLLTRDQVSCGMCDNMCECAQRKYGQILYTFESDKCRWPIVTDQVFHRRIRYRYLDMRQITLASAAACLS